jgi:hypothetical protein
MKNKAVKGIWKKLPARTKIGLVLFAAKAAPKVAKIVLKARKR